MDLLPRTSAALSLQWALRGMRYPRSAHLIVNFSRSYAGQMSLWCDILHVVACGTCVWSAMGPWPLEMGRCLVCPSPPPPSALSARTMSTTAPSCKSNPVGLTVVSNRLRLYERFAELQCYVLAGRRRSGDCQCFTVHQTNRTPQYDAGAPLTGTRCNSVDDSQFINVPDLRFDDTSFGFTRNAGCGITSVQVHDVLHDDYAFYIVSQIKIFSGQSPDSDTSAYIGLLRNSSSITWTSSVTSTSLDRSTKPITHVCLSTRLGCSSPTTFNNHLGCFHPTPSYASLDSTRRTR
ncbi:hypothetical protein BD309DRAFT_731811 [Dichomitus squalens]|nr:hypothetical protein BD309DRAFT_731811 [Dichomitus squalens]